ncbi:hypothetical protein [Neomegalonema sp.]|uniref:hypothetical protein n=1 Tax=Neomegalonema sp. TaxID=2039713 RepID=UPI00261DFF45|nr:hypothetical protein [Neomegalonema sp.]MDD2870109.1 hypothetical protein [Neomegalonema sp.]
MSDSDPSDASRDAGSSMDPLDILLGEEEDAAVVVGVAAALLAHACIIRFSRLEDAQRLARVIARAADLTIVENWPRKTEIEAGGEGRVRLAPAAPFGRRLS